MTGRLIAVGDIHGCAWEFEHLLEKLALTRHDRLILLGDKDQLASVEAGAVLADLCNGDELRQYSDAFAQEFKTITGQTLPAAPPDAAGFCTSFLFPESDDEEETQQPILSVQQFGILDN